MISTSLVVGFVCLGVLVGTAQASIVTKTVDYKQGDTVLEGYLAYDDAKTGPRPGIMIVHDWNGLDDYEQMRARQLAELGYVAFAVDIYGKGVRPKNNQESGAEAGKYRGEVPLCRARLQAGLDELRKQPNVDQKKVGAIGYCFGGGGVLELARMGADLNCVCSFHGALGTTMPAQAGVVKAKVMVIHAAQDPSCPRKLFDTFLDEMKDAKVDYQTVIYNLDVHPFTVVGGPSYDATADKRSWAAMKAFFNEVFGQ